MILSIGQIIPRKGIDVLLEASTLLSSNYGIYIVGGEATEELKSILESNRLKNVHFVGFKSKDELATWYRAADVFVMPTREDIWGLVINEAMSYGLPVISTDRCGAALELVRDGENGLIVHTDDPKALAQGIETIRDSHIASEQIIDSIRNHTIENMVLKHMDLFQEL